MMRTASMRLDVSDEQAEALAALRTVYADACNRLVPVVRDHRLWNRVGLHQRAYNDLREATLLGSQMCCNAIYSVCKAYKSQKKLGRIRKDSEVPAIRFDHASVHFDKRTCTLKGDGVSLYTLSGRITVALRLGDHQRRILESGQPKEAELVLRKGAWFFNRVVESGDAEPVTSGPVMGVAAASDLRRVQGEGRRHRGRVRESGLHQPDLFLLWGVGQTCQTSFRVRKVWSPGACRLECKSKPCPDRQRCFAVEGGCKYA